MSSYQPNYFLPFSHTKHKKQTERAASLYEQCIICYNDVTISLWFTEIYSSVKKYPKTKQNKTT